MSNAESIIFTDKKYSRNYLKKYHPSKCARFNISVFQTFIYIYIYMNIYICIYIFIHLLFDENIKTYDRSTRRLSEPWFYRRSLGPVPSKDTPPPPFQKWPYLHERCPLCWTEWKINFPIFIFRVMVYCIYEFQVCHLNFHVCHQPKTKIIVQKWPNLKKRCAMLWNGFL